ncbi:hypothetical protein [Blastococcus sp. PRF04-17]|uniref:hypothetical protein n=1 Tax=Blastococcus sp. PRF04-17 TaxID=2933797 RepID=UPI001FF559A4|nr:hypothetical protein [Blastococcus sp. PRF04-17]UOY01638.1 hypothetical protein MVA48_22415 [Blastococcus sp. PRF04-17]
MTEVPPGPWRWEQVDPGALERRRRPTSDRDDDHDARRLVGPQGWGLIGADGTPVLLHDGGWGTVDLGADGGFWPAHPIAQLLARAGDIPQLERDLRTADAALTTARRDVDRLAADVAEARSWARLLVDTVGISAFTSLGAPPDWLTAPWTGESPDI